MACACIGNRVLIVEQVSYFLLSVMSVLLLCNNFSYLYPPDQRSRYITKDPRASQFSLKSELIINMVNCFMCVLYKAVQLKSIFQYTTDGPIRNALFPFASLLLCLWKLAVPCTDKSRKWKRRYKILK